MSGQRMPPTRQHASYSTCNTTQQRDFAVDQEGDDSIDAPSQERALESDDDDDKAGRLLRAEEPPFGNGNGRRLSFIDQDGLEAQPETPGNTRAVGWLDLPHKRQLAILTIARLGEPLTQSSIQSYMFFQLQSFDRSLPDSTIATQAGMLQGSFTAAQFLTAMLWGRMSDADWGGRKRVLLAGLLGSYISNVGYGLARSYWQALLFRTLGGVLNGNVGVMRTMISEIVEEKRFQPTAFLLLPMCFNIGVIIGPILGGLLADPAKNYPDTFGHVAWLQKFPYSTANLLIAAYLLIAAISVFFGLEETLDTIRHKEDLGSKCGRKLRELFSRNGSRTSSSDQAYMPVDGEEQSQELLDESYRRSDSVEMSPISPKSPKPTRKRTVSRYKNKLPFRRIFTRNVILTFLAHAILSCHTGAFNNLWFIFLSTPVFDPAHPHPPDYKERLPFKFTGGMGMPARHVGMAMAVLGVIGITMQLFVYPTVNAKLGVLKSWRIFLFCFPVAYILVPFLAIVPSKSPPPAEKDGIIVWAALCGILFIQVLGRTFALPASIILLNNCSPHPSVLGTIHGMGQSIASAVRTIGPVLGGWLYGVGLEHGVVGGVWWGLSCVALCTCISSAFVREGDGHEIRLEGDDEAEAEFQADAAATAAAKVEAAK